MDPEGNVAIAEAVIETTRQNKNRHHQKPKRQPRYHVFLWNDDNHSYEYVMLMLNELFGHELEKGFGIAKNVDQNGKAIVLTTTSIDIDEELMNRCLVLTVDESREQTERIHELQREARTIEGILAVEKRKDVLRIMQNAQRLLKPWKIANPFARHLTFTSGRTRTRRDHEKYLTLIDSIALLHQHQREPVTHQVNGREVAMLPVTIEDIEAANKIAPEVLGRSLDELPPQTRRLLEHVKEFIRNRMKAESVCR